LSGGAQFLKSIYIAPDLTASVIGNPNDRMAFTRAREQEHRCEHPREKFHASCTIGSRPVAN
jgi:hypothetical protein